MKILVKFSGWAGWTRTTIMSGPKPDALPVWLPPKQVILL